MTKEEESRITAFLNREKRRRKMDEFEKVEKLRQRVDVTYEEAKEALKQADGDLLDAVIWLENQGKTVKTEQTTRSTSYSMTL